MDNPYETPKATIYGPTGTNPKTLKEILFSFEGRIPRRTYWGVGLLTSFAVAGIIGLILLLLSNSNGINPIALVVAAPLYLVLLYSSVALQAKRWHDRDKSGWWFFITFVPIIGGIWFLVEAGCLRGTVGPNKYGEDPT